MPIQQRRVIALINAALDAFKATGRMKTFIEGSYGITIDESRFFESFNETHHIIMHELQWYSTHSARNANAAQKMRELRERRRADGDMPPPSNRRMHIPKSLYETDKLSQPENSPHVREYRAIPLLTIEEKEKEEIYRAERAKWRARGKFDNTQPCIRGCGNEPEVAWCPLEGKGLVCPANKTRVWEEGAPELIRQSNPQERQPTAEEVIASLRSNRKEEGDAIPTIDPDEPILPPSGSEWNM